MGKRHCDTMQGNTGTESNLVSRSNRKRSGLFGKRAGCGRKNCCPRQAVRRLPIGRLMKPLAGVRLPPGKPRIGTAGGTAMAGVRGVFGPKMRRSANRPGGAGSAPRRFLALKARGDTSRLPIARTWPITPPRCDTWSSGTSADCGEIKTVYGAKDRPTSFPTPSGRPAITGSRCRVSSWTMTTYCCFAACWRSRRDARPDARRLATVP